MGLRSRSLPRLSRKLQDALGDQLSAALDDPTVIEIFPNPNGKLYTNGSVIASPAGENEQRGCRNCYRRRRARPRLIGR
jgi:hypothetical protein